VRITTERFKKVIVSLFLLSAAGSSAAIAVEPIRLYVNREIEAVPNLARGVAIRASD